MTRPGPACRFLIVSVTLASALWGCASESTRDPDQGATGGSGTAALPLLDAPRVAGFAEALEETAPDDNLLTEPRAQLGKRLFFEKRLSRDNTISCGSCHDQAHGFADPRKVSLGVEDRPGKRNAPHLVNLAWVQGGFFWEGRAASLEEQASQPIEEPLEMDLKLSEAIARLASDSSYVEAFEDAYGGPPSKEFLQKALASFVRTLVSADSPYDRYLAGDENALSEEARRGLTIFLGDQGGCFHCHSQQTLTNDGFFNNGSFEEGGDVGRQALTGRTGDLGKFRTPSLRNVEVTAPYMHDGSLETLEEVIDQYARGGRGDPSTDPQIQPLSLGDGDRSDLLLFLQSLTDEGFLTDPRFRHEPSP